MPTLPLATKPRHSPADLEPFLSGGARRIFSRKSVASLYRPPGALWKCSSEMRNEPCFTFPRVSPFRAFHLSARLRCRRASDHLIPDVSILVQKRPQSASSFFV